MRGALRALHGREKEIYDSILEHVEMMSEGADLLHEAITLVLKGESISSHRIAERIAEIEKKCDVKSEEIIEKIINSIKQPTLREDLLGLVLSLERVAKAVEAVAYRVEMCSELELPDVLKKDLLKFTDAVLRTVHSLKAVSHMPFYHEEALEKINEIHVFEEKADEVRRKLMCDFVANADKVSLANFYLLMEIVNNLEEVADRCEEAGSVIKIIIASIKS